MPDALDDRLRAVERALDGSDDRAASVTTTPDETSTARQSAPAHARDGDQLDDLESRLDAAETATADLEGAVQALRGYAGKVRSVDERVEERADAALAAVETLEDRVDELESQSTPVPERQGPGRDEHCPHCAGRRDDGRPSDEPPAGGRRERTLDAGWPTSPAPRFEHEDGGDASRGVLARLRDRL
ncbi:DUF7310 family coiled-coil domain-containing protein [Haloarchaeobius iranensis]|uniref:DUF7310 domain-containing protein n=1 Tax=Haloarchaeobius iranensis TaxID=996166 RepID=A0A1G9T979_9EURY|nr:hypothetical protein [Haloarchaeobius iranensis]SDM44178.1 hypothetical protein SAMN05192554_102211 [Haloarchaeobius iranensis]